MPAYRSSSSRASRRDRLSEMRRADILGAAIRVFSRKGFDAAHAEEIAAAAGIAKGTLYLYFRSKEDIYTAALTETLHQLADAIERRSESTVGFAARLAVAIQIRLEFWVEHRELYRLLLTLGRSARHRRQTHDILRAAQASLLAIFEEGVQRGELVPDEFGPLAWATLDMLRGANERRIDRVSETTPEQDAATITAFVLHLVARPGLSKA